MLRKGVLRGANKKKQKPRGFCLFFMKENFPDTMKSAVRSSGINPQPGSPDPDASPRREGFPQPRRH